MPRWDTFKVERAGGYAPEVTSGVPVTPSVTPSNTPTPSITASATSTPTPTPSITASSTNTPTPTPVNVAKQVAPAAKAATSKALADFRAGSNPY